MVKTTVKYICDRCGKEIEFCADGSGDYKKIISWGRVSIDSGSSIKYNLCHDCLLCFSSVVKSFMDEGQVEDCSTIYYVYYNNTDTYTADDDFDSALERYVAYDGKSLYKMEYYKDRAIKYLWNPVSNNFEVVS